MKGLSCNPMHRFQGRFLPLPTLPVGAWKARRHLGQLARLTVAPALLGAFAGIEFSREGPRIAAVAAYGLFVVAYVAMRAWDVWQFRRARLRLAAARTRLARREGHNT